MTSAPPPSALAPVSDQSSSGQNPAPGSTRGRSFAALFLIFSFAFVLSPYWAKPKPPIEKIGGLLLTASTGLAWAWLAARQSAPKRLPPSPRKARILMPLLSAAGLLIFLLWLNARALRAGVPWRGDEDFHITRTAKLVANLSGGWTQHLWLIAIVILSALFLWAARRHPKLSARYLAPCLGLVAIQSAWILAANPVYMTSLGRYPYINRWLTALPLVILQPLINVTPPITSPLGFAEALYRWVPFLSTALLGWVSYHRLSHPQPESLQPAAPASNRLFAFFRRAPICLVAIAFAFAVISAPLSVYYTSTLYIEMPAVLLMTIAAFSAPHLLQSDPDHLGRDPAWYALILIGFVKETTVPFLAAFIACRLLTRFLILIHRQPRGLNLRNLLNSLWQKSRAAERRVFAPISRRRNEEYLNNTLSFDNEEIAAKTQDRPARLLPQAVKEAGVLLAVLLPLALYLFFRHGEEVKRGFTPSFANLRDPALWRLIAFAYAKQFGWGLCALSAAGFIIMLIRRKFAWAIFLAAAFAADALLHLLDDPRFIGYSRFNLFLLPTIIVAASQPLLTARQWLADRPSIRSLVLLLVVLPVLVLTIIQNLAASPLNLDGTKISRWGDYGFDTAEHYYPYRQALQWLDKHAAGRQVMLAGLDYKYETGLYATRSVKITLERTRWDRNTLQIPHDNPDQIQRALQTASEKHCDILLYHLYDNWTQQQIDALPLTAGFTPPLVFRTNAHTLLLFQRPASPPQR